MPRRMKDSGLQWVGKIPAEWSEGADIDEHNVANACVWFALEECANKWTEGEEVDDEGRAE